MRGWRLRPIAKPPRGPNQRRCLVAALARVQTYSTALIVKHDDILARLDEAIASAEKSRGSEPR